MSDAIENHRNEVAERIARNVPVIEEYRATGGKLSGPFSAMNIVLVHHFGAKTGIERVSPMAYRDCNGAIAVFGANGGRTMHPNWYFNLVARPDTTIELGGQSLSVRARIAQGDERTEIWEAQKRDEPMFAEFEKVALREIPVLIFDQV